MIVRRFVAALSVSALLWPTAAGASSMRWLVPPVDGAVVARFSAPASRFGPGHRGIDYAVPEGTAVRAAGPGTVAFAGAVAGSMAVTIDHGDGLVTTYSRLSEINVQQGARVDSGTWIGRSSRAHVGSEPGLHLSVRLDGNYVDPERYLASLDVSQAIHLVPLDAKPDDCLRPPPAASGRAPNDNIAVAVAGIGSSTRGEVTAEIYKDGPERLGYAGDRIYEFSYAGLSGAELHRPYDRTDTYGDLRAAAARLRALLSEIAARHPGADVDLIAHSQGGIVARLFLQQMADKWSADLPRIEHLVTFATPHGGAPLAGLGASLGRETLLGGLLVEGASWWSRRGGPIPDPASPAVRQLTPESPLMRSLAAEDIAFGTRALTLAMPHDVMVPADRAALPEETNRIVPGPLRADAHDAVVRSPAALAIARAFLRDAPAACTGLYDRIGPLIGGAIGWMQSKAPELYSKLERRFGGKLVRWGLKGVRHVARAGWRIVRPGLARLWRRR